MKKLLCVALTLMMLIMALTVVPVSADAGEDNTLIITANGENPVAVEVGNEIVFRVGLYAGSVKILNGQVEMGYDADLLSYVPYEVYTPAYEEYSVEGYSFPSSILNAGIVFNPDEAGAIKYNFTKAQGVAVFNDPSKLFARFRFKVLAPGTTDISHIIQYMVDMNEQNIYYKEVPSTVINPYMNITIVPSEGLVGDANGDYEVSILDATFLQRAAAGANLDYDVKTADLTGDKSISLKDALIVRKYLAGHQVDSAIGTWLFATE